MAFLKKQVKSVLLLLAEEFNTTGISDKNKVLEIIGAITKAGDYDEETARLFLERILIEREELEKALEREERKKALEREDREKALEREERNKALEREEREKDRIFELEKLKIQAARETNIGRPIVSVTESSSKRINLKDLVPKFDPKHIDVALFFTIFERQARKEKVEEENWVSQLISLLPAEIVEVIVKEPEEKADDFQHMKQVLLNRFKMSARTLKEKFEGHNKKPDVLWTDLVYELRVYLEGWLDALQISSIQEIKELLITEQIKKRVSGEIREHFLDEWDEIKTASVLAEKCDKFEAVRKDNKKSFERKNYGQNSFKKPFGQKFGQESLKFSKNGKNGTDKSVKIEKSEPRSKPYENRTREFEKPRQITCFGCGNLGHIRPNCPQNPSRKDYPIHFLNVEEKLGEGFKPYIHSAIVNGEEVKYLRDSGSCIDLVEINMISTEDLLPEQIWIKQPLDAACKCLPLARVVIKTENGSVTTKAAVKPAEFSQGFYLMGNITNAMLEAQKNKIHPVNAVFTRSQARGSKASEPLIGAQGENERSKFRFKETKEEIISTEVQGGENREEEGEHLDDSSEPAVIPFLAEEEKSLLSKVSGDVFCEEQKKCTTLKGLWERALNSNEKEFKVKNERLVRISESNRGEQKIQLCVPKIYQNDILDLCHNAVSGHLGTTKTKDRILANFFWPHCYKQIEDYVRTCELCQKVGKNRDKKKAPLKLVPIISEPFRRLSIDAIGPLMVSENNNRYAITAICMASKYPDAIPIENLSSKNVIHALIQIFAKTGYPREIQCDLGTSFTSELTTAFFDKSSIKVSHSSLQHPESQPVERFHSTVKRVIRTLCLESKNDWERVLPMALFALRTVTHESTGFSPAELVFGKNLRMPHTIIYENWMREDEVSQNVVDYILELNGRLRKCQDLATKNMEDSQKKRKLWYDKKAVLRKFKVGDQVLVLATARPHKMAVSWLGPGVVTGVISETNYTVDLPEKRSKDTIYHVNLMKPYHKRPEYVNLLIEGCGEEIEKDADIPYPLLDATQFDFNELVRESKLENRLDEEKLGVLKTLLFKHKSVFSSDPGSTPLVEMDITLIDDKPVRARPYRMSPRQTEILRNEIKRLLELGVIEVGQSDFAAPMILVESPGKDPRPCIDYRALNAKTQVEFFPLPNIEEVVEKVSAASFITVMDLTKGYFQIPLTKRAQRYATFVTPFGGYLPNKMMFGMQNAPYVFCKLMSIVLDGLESFALPYIDDIAIFSSTWEQHVRHLDIVLKRLSEAKLRVKPSKCRFGQDHVRFLGHEVGSGKRSPSEVKIKAIQDFPTPTTKTKIRAFIGLTGFYSRYINGYATKAAPLTEKLKGKMKREKIEWDEGCEQAFRSLKAELTKSPVLYAPDFTREFILQTDASLVGAGIILAQVFENGEEHPIVYLSKKFSKAEKNYSTIEREMAAIIFGVKKLNHYLDGQRFVLQTDHNPLVYLKTMVGSNARLTRWALCLQQYNFTVEHKPGRAHANADALSRIHEV